MIMYRRGVEMRIVRKSMLALLVLVSLLQTAGIGKALPVLSAAKADTGYTTFAAIIEWRYKVEDGKLYRRQYNRSTGKWIGEWEWCP